MYVKIIVNHRRSANCPDGQIFQSNVQTVVGWKMLLPLHSICSYNYQIGLSIVPVTESRAIHLIATTSLGILI